MNDNRPLHVLAARCAFLFGIPLLEGETKPANPKLQATRIQGVPHDGYKDTVPMWLEFGKGLEGSSTWDVIVTDGKGYRRTLVTGRTPKAFREAFDAAEKALEGAEALRPWKIRV